MAESIVFLSVGALTFILLFHYSKTDFDGAFIGITLLMIVVIRFFNVFMLNTLTNACRASKARRIHLRDSLIQWWGGGLRGPICFGKYLLFFSKLLQSFLLSTRKIHSIGIGIAI
jgi:hypothetical protein